MRTYAQPYNNTLTVESAKLGVPVVLTVDAEAKPKRATLVDTFDQIEQDLLDAEAAIDPAYVRDGGNNDASKVSIYAIQALLSRVYLYMENWQKAADYATKVIDSGKFKMWTAAQVTDGDKCVWREDTRKEGEVIFEVWTNQTQTYGTGNENVWAMTTYLGYGDCGASADLLDLYEAGDARKTLVQPDPDGNGLFTKKYFGKGVGSIDANNIIILRLSEMYLNRAEALLHPGVTVTGASAATDLATIASNRGATTLDPTLANVYKEQAKEFAWEAHLWFDLARTGRPMTRTDVSGTSIPTDIQPGDYRWAMPIANRELTVNPNLIQNDGYNN